MLGKKLQKFDIFGRDVNFFYKGQEYFSTRWGCIMSIFVTVFYLIMVSLKWTEFFGETDPLAYFSETRQSMEYPINLTELGFTFAVDNLEASIGQIEATQVHWSGKDGVKRETVI